MDDKWSNWLLYYVEIVNTRYENPRQTKKGRAENTSIQLSQDVYQQHSKVCIVIMLRSKSLQQKTSLERYDWMRSSHKAWKVVWHNVKLSGNIRVKRGREFGVWMLTKILGFARRFRPFRSCQQYHGKISTGIMIGMTARWFWERCYLVLLSSIVLGIAVEIRRNFSKSYISILKIGWWK